MPSSKSNSKTPRKRSSYEKLKDAYKELRKDFRKAARLKDDSSMEPAAREQWTTQHDDLEERQRSAKSTMQSHKNYDPKDLKKMADKEKEKDLKRKEDEEKEARREQRKQREAREEERKKATKASRARSSKDKEMRR